MEATHSSPTENKNSTKKKASLCYTVFKWVLLVCSYGYLIYKLCTYDNYQGLRAELAGISFSHFQWLLYVLLLLPLNWILESYKWKCLCNPFEKISLATAIKSVLAGLIPGFLTPNRIGEIIGRPLLLKEENRISGAMMTVVSSFSQTITIIACGTPSAVFFFFRSSLLTQHEYKHYTYFCVFWLLLFMLLYIQIPQIARWLSTKKIARKMQKELIVLGSLSYKSLFTVLGYSLLRYSVFCLQFYFILFFCNVYLSPVEALIVITLNYLFITITPSISFTEVAVRASYAVFFIGFFSGNTIGIASAGIMLWLINFIFPMLVGSFFFAKTKI